MRKLLLVCALLIGVSTISFAQGGGQRSPDDQLATLKTQVSGITDAQATKIKAIYAASNDDLTKALKSAGSDRTAISAVYKKSQTATFTKVKDVLTGDQKAAYQKAVIDLYNERAK